MPWRGRQSSPGRCEPPAQCESKLYRNAGLHDEPGGSNIDNDRQSGGGLWWRPTRRGITGRRLIETMVRGTGFGRSPVNQETHIGSKDLRMPEKTHGRSLRWCRGVGGLLELLGWPVAQRRVQAETIVVLLDERLDVSAQ